LMSAATPTVGRSR